MDKPPTDDLLLCQELCEKLNLSDPTQITEIMRILTSNAPHVLKEPPPIHTSTVNKGLSEKYRFATIHVCLL